uniref:Peptidyl-prolyl cis-trans isomerase n=1 Tax=Lygus hesperus TaxID=30085 RepID=A0A0A9Y704_LYGHE
MIQGGDIENNDGSGGESIYGVYFADENFIRRHHSRGMLSMANVGPNTNSSQFFITYQPTPLFNGRNVVFGKLVGGWEVLDAMEMVPIDHDDRPCSDITIRNCGIVASTVSAVSGAEEQAAAQGNQDAGACTQVETTAAPNDACASLGRRKLSALRELRFRVQGVSQSDVERLGAGNRDGDGDNRKATRVIPPKGAHSQLEKCMNQTAFECEEWEEQHGKGKK